MYPGITENEIVQINKLLAQQELPGRSNWFDAEQKINELKILFSKKYPKVTIKSYTKKDNSYDKINKQN